MDTTNLIFCGLGGQGILFMTRVLAETAMNLGLNVMGAETHGMAQRGGSVISHLKIGDVESSLVRKGSADYLLSLDENEGYRNLPFLSKGGRLFVNSNNPLFPKKEVNAYLEKKEIQTYTLAAATVAGDMNAPKSSNLALLGYFSVFNKGLISDEAMKATIANISPERFKKINLEVFKAGHQKGLSDRKGHRKK